MLTFVLGGGGAKGAYQAGALRALLEAQIQPDMLVGTSIGALNASFLAVHGVTLSSVADLSQTWCEAEESGLILSGGTWSAARVLLGLAGNRYYSQLRDFCIDHGLTPQLTFGQLGTVKLLVVATDLTCHQPMVFGTSPYHTILDAVLASAAIPPLVLPVRQGEHLLADGGIVSNLPIEPAMTHGATEIIALNLGDTTYPEFEEGGSASLPRQVLVTAAKRQYDLELALAAARHVPIKIIHLRGKERISTLGPCAAPELIQQGYDLAKQAIATWPQQTPSRWRQWWHTLARVTSR